MRQAKVIVRMPLAIIDDVAAEFLHHLLERTGHVPVGVGLRLQTEVGGVLPAGRVGLCGNQPVSQVIASRYLGTAAMFSAQTRTRSPRDTRDQTRAAKETPD